MDPHLLCEAKSHILVSYISNNGPTNLQNACAGICYWFFIAENCIHITLHMFSMDKKDMCKCHEHCMQIVWMQRLS